MCSRTVCHADKDKGDEYFCLECRQEYRNFTESMGIHLQTPDGRVLEHLRFFQSRK